MGSLIDVKDEDDDGVSVKLSIVKYTNKSKSELTRMMFQGEIISRYTTPDKKTHLARLLVIPSIGNAT